MKIIIKDREWDIEELKKTYENDFDTRKAWCQFLGYSEGTHFKQIINKAGFKAEDFGKNREKSYKKFLKKGDIFGFLSVLEPNCEKDQYNRFRTLCLCKCGSQIIVNNNSLFSGNTTSCGCKNGNNNKNRIKNGDVFGNLTVIDANNYHLFNSKTLSSLCQCSCGQTKIISNSSLRTGNSKSCGCINGRDESNKIKKGDIFGDLIVIEPYSKTIKDRNKCSYSSRCQCICGAIKEVLNSSLRNGKTLSCGCNRMSKGERKIENFLEKKNIAYKKEYSFSDLKGATNPLRFDFALFSLKKELIGLIEFQGQQHYESSSYFGGEERLKRQQENDNRKRQYCGDKNIPLFEIPYYEYENLEQILEKKLLEWEVID